MDLSEQKPVTQSKTKIQENEAFSFNQLCSALLRWLHLLDVVKRTENVNSEMALLLEAMSLGTALQGAPYHCHWKICALACPRHFSLIRPQWDTEVRDLISTHKNLFVKGRAVCVSYPCKESLSCSAEQNFRAVSYGRSRNWGEKTGRATGSGQSWLLRPLARLVLLLERGVVSDFLPFEVNCSNKGWDLERVSSEAFWGEKACSFQFNGPLGRKVRKKDHYFPQ